MQSDFQSLMDFYLAQRSSPPAAFAVRKNTIKPESLYSLRQFQNDLNNPLLSPDWLQIVEQGKVLDLQKFAFGKSVQGKSLSFLDKTVVNDAVARGAAIVLEGLDIFDSRMNDLVSVIDEAMPCSLSNSVAFFSQKGNEAYHGHCDTDDVLVVQIGGKKIWHIYEPQQRRYLDTSPLGEDRLGRKIAEVTLAPGDVLYVRAGVPHRCSTPEAFSLHLSFDLIDMTPRVDHIAREAHHRYNLASAEPYVGVQEVVTRFAELLQSEKFRADLERATVQTRKNAQNFRDRIGRASAVNFLGKFE